MEKINFENTSFIEVSESALANNLEFIKRELLSKGQNPGCVLKSDAYGHGVHIVAPILHKLGAGPFFVFSAYEAAQLRNSLGQESTEIVIMGDLPDEALKWAVENGVQFYVYDLLRLENAMAMADKTGKKARIHLELETGMNRLGLDPFELEKALSAIIENRARFVLEGVCTHYAGAEKKVNHVRVREQIKRFLRAKAFVEEKGVAPNSFHSACSAAALRFPETRMDMVRAGILVYGHWPSLECKLEFMREKGLSEDPLMPALSWKTRVMAVKRVKAGEFVGYGESFHVQGDKRLAILPVGYGNGFARFFSNNGSVLLAGRAFPVVGMVNMNAMAVDLGSYEDVRPGDEAVLIGRQGEAFAGVDSFAEDTARPDYESLARLPKDIPRHLVK